MSPFAIGLPTSTARSTAPSQPTATKSPQRWNLFSMPESPQARVLDSETHHWLRRIPRTHHPKALCLQFPWVANKLSRVWHDPAMTEWLLSEVMTDLARFTAANSALIQLEIRRIRALHWQRRSEKLIQRLFEGRSLPCSG